MSDYTLTIPDSVYDRAKRIAQETAQPVEDVLLHQLDKLEEPALPPDQQAELDALRHLSDDALWTIAREQMPEAIEARAHTLMDKNSLRQITDEEYAELEQLSQRADGLMLRKAEAASILRERGYPFTQDDYKAKHD